MRRVWIPAVAGSLVLTAGLIAIAYDQRGATPAHAADVASAAVADQSEARAPGPARPAAAPQTDAFGGGWDAGYGAARDAATEQASAEPADDAAQVAADPYGEDAAAPGR